MNNAHISILHVETIKKRPLVLFSSALITGTMIAKVAGGMDNTQAAVLLSILLFSVFLAGLALLFGEAAFNRGILLLMVVFFAFGAVRFMLLERENREVYSGFDGRTVKVHGYVASEPEIKDLKVSYIINPISVSALTSQSTRPEAANHKILLATLLQEDQKILEYGSEVTFEGELVKPKGERNPGGFDYRSYLAGKGVAARVFSLNIKHGGRSKAIWPVRVGRELNESITRIMEECLPKQQAGLLAGILTGNREGLGDTVKDAFSAAGLTHIMAVSGANVAFIVLPLTFLLKKIKVPLKIANIMIICFLVVFIFITGFEPSVLRAVIMAVFILTAQLLRRDSDILTVIAASALVLLLASPYMLYNIGFQLSYSATIALVLLFNDVKKLVCCRFIPEFLSSVLAATITAQLGVLPLTLLYFNRVSVVSLLTNLLVVPLIEIVTVTGMIMAVSGHIHLMLAQLPGYVNCTLLSFILYVVKLSYKLPFAVLTTATPPLFAVMAYYPVVYFAMKRGPSYFAGMKPSKILRHIAVALLLLLIFFVGIQNLTPEKLEVVFLDVGEGDCTFIRSANGSLMLIDGGGSTNPLRESGIGDSTVLPFLLDNGVTSMEAVLATHGHADHTQGLETVLERLPVKNLILPEIQDVEAPAGGFGELLKIAEEKGVKVSYCSEGDEIRLDSETKLKVLNPGINETSLSSGALNNTSLVVKLLYADVSILFTGDAGTAVEERLLKKRTELDVDIIKIAHHGSVTATGFEFLEAVSPLAAIISVGRNNFGHPSQKVLQNVGDSGAILLRTDECGAVMLEVTDGTFLNKNSEIRIKRMVSQ